MTNAFEDEVLRIYGSTTDGVGITKMPYLKIEVILAGFDRSKLTTLFKQLGKIDQYKKYVDLDKLVLSAGYQDSTKTFVAPREVLARKLRYIRKFLAKEKEKRACQEPGARKDDGQVGQATAGDRIIAKLPPGPEQRQSKRRRTGQRAAAQHE
jgi:hypothetical protein